MTPDDWARVMNRTNWRLADLHDLRLRYAGLLADIAAHRQALWSQDIHDADRTLWSVLDRERL